MTTMKVFSTIQTLFLLGISRKAFTSKGQSSVDMQDKNKGEARASQTEEAACAQALWQEGIWRIQGTKQRPAWLKHRDEREWKKMELGTNGLDLMGPQKLLGFCSFP